MDDKTFSALEEVFKKIDVTETIDPAIEFLRETFRKEADKTPSSGWSMKVSELKRALRYVPDNYEVMLENGDVDDCEIATLHVTRMYPPTDDSPGLLVLSQGQVVSYEYAYHDRMDEDHNLGVAFSWNNGKWSSR